MNYHSNMTSKGQVTVPKDIRDALGLEPGERVAFELNADGEARILKSDKVGKAEARRARFLQRLAKAQSLFRAEDQYPGMATDQYMAMVREPIQPFETPPKE